MDFLLIMNSWVLICSLVGFIYGVRAFFKPRKPIFLQIITCAVACLMYSRLFHVLFMLVQGDVKFGENIGMLGLAGSLMFLLSANYGQMDSLVDDGTKKFLPTRIIALIAPIAVIAIYIVMFMTVTEIPVRIGIGVLVFFMIPCVYYNFKHIIIYDVNLGLIRPLRPYNILALVYAFSILIVYLAQCLNMMELYIGCMAVQGIVSAAILPVAKKGVAQWTI